MPFDWMGTPEAVDKLLACSTDELEALFPGMKRKTLINRRAEFRRKLDDVPASNHGSGDTAKTVEREVEVEDELVPRSLYLEVVKERDEALSKNKQYASDLRTKERSDSIRTAPRTNELSRKTRAVTSGTVHVVIPDTQAKPGVPTDHLRWIGEYIVDHLGDRENIKIIHLGDHADMPSLSSYDKGKRSMEGRRVVADIEAANDAFEELNAPLIEHNRYRSDSTKWLPEKYLTLGNHEFRIIRATEDDPQLEGFLSVNSLNYESLGWHVQPFLKPLLIDGVAYAHYWANPLTGKPYGGQALTRLKTIGTSYTMGHQQVLDYAIRFVQGRSQHGLVAGAAYVHSEDYKSYQGNAHWRGIIVCNEVRNGQYDPMFVSLGYLCRRYEGMPIETFVKRKYKFDYMGSDAWK